MEKNAKTTLGLSGLDANAWFGQIECWVLRRMILRFGNVGRDPWRNNAELHPRSALYQDHNPLWRAGSPKDAWVYVG